MTRAVGKCFQSFFEFHKLSREKKTVRGKEKALLSAAVRKGARDPPPNSGEEREPDSKKRRKSCLLGMTTNLFIRKYALSITKRK